MNGEGVGDFGITLGGEKGNKRHPGRRRKRKRSWNTEED